MGKQEIINKVIEGLKTDPFYGVSLYSETDLGRLEIGTNLTREFMEQQTGSVEEFFNRIYRNGVKKLGIQVRRKNGTNPKKNLVNWKSIGDYITLELHENEAPKEVEFEPKIQAKTMQHNVQHDQPLTAHPIYPAYPPALGNPFGLSGPEVIRLNVRSADADRLEREINELKPKYENALRELGELKLEKLQWTDKKASADSTASILSGIIEKGPEIVQAFATMKTGATPAAVAPAGLAIPSDLSETQNQMIEVIVDNDPAVSQLLFRIASGLSKDGFFEKLNELLTQHEL